jgi:hypothetical protein
VPPAALSAADARAIDERRPNMHKRPFLAGLATMVVALAAASRGGIDDTDQARSGPSGD